MSINEKKIVDFKVVTKANDSSAFSSGLYSWLMFLINLYSRVKKNLKIVQNKISKKSKSIFLLHQVHSSKFIFIDKNFRFNKNKIIAGTRRANSMFSFSIKLKISSGSTSGIIIFLQPKTIPITPILAPAT